MKTENIDRDSRSDLEREFDTGKPLDGVFLRRLIGILKRERDCMVSNWKTAEKENRKLNQQNERWKFFRSLLPFVNKHDLKEVNDKLTQILMTQKELQAALDGMNEQLDKATTEILAEIDTLKGTLTSAPISEAAKASLDRLASKVQALDDLNPDITTPTPTPTTEPPTANG